MPSPTMRLIPCTHRDLRLSLGKEVPIMWPPPLPLWRPLAAMCHPCLRQRPGGVPCAAHVRRPLAIPPPAWLDSPPPSMTSARRSAIWRLSIRSATRMSRRSSSVGKRGRARDWWRASSMTAAHAPAVHSSKSTAPPSRRVCWKPSCSASRPEPSRMLGAPSPAWAYGCAGYAAAALCRQRRGALPA